MAGAADRRTLGVPLTAATWGATWSANWWEANGQEINTHAKVESLGGERAVVLGMIFVFVVGSALGNITIYITTYIIRSMQIPPPAGPTAEARAAKEFGKGAQASITRRPVAGTMPTLIFITKTGVSFHCEGCSHLAVGDRADTNKTFARCSVCFRDA